MLPLPVQIFKYGGKLHAAVLDHRKVSLVNCFANWRYENIDFQGV